MNSKMKLIILTVLAAVLCLAVVSASAERVNPNTVITGRLGDRGSVNRYTFTLFEDSALQFALEFNVNASYDFTFSAIGEDGTLSDYYQCTFDFSGTSVLDTVTRKTPTLRFRAGSYCVSIARTSYTTYSGAAYYLTVSAQPLLSGQAEVSPNGSARNATPIQPNVSVTGNTDTRDDVDFFRIDLPQNGLFQIKLNGADGACYTVFLHKLVDNELHEKYSFDLNYDAVTVSGAVDQYGSRIRLGAGSYYVQISRRAYCNLCTADYLLTCQYRPRTPPPLRCSPTPPPPRPSACRLA